MEPTAKQIAYLKKLTGITAEARLKRYVARRTGRPVEGRAAPVVTRLDASRAIAAELADRARYR
jgi:hypothetical protein